MAQTNYTPIQLYHSTTPSAVPNPSNLTSGELAINTYDGVLYFKNTAGSIQVLATQSGAAANIAGGSTGALVYQSGVSATSFLTLATAGDIVVAGASAPQYVSPSTLTVGTATNIAGGALGSMPYQSAAGSTTFVAAGTNGQVLTISGGVPTWATSGTATLAANLAGGAAGNVVYQTGLNTTGFTAAGTSGQVFISNGASAPSWVNQSSIAAGTATTATNIGGGVLGAIPYQTAVGTTAFLSLGSTNQVLTAGIAGPQYVAQSTLSVGSATTSTNIAGGVTGSVPYQTSAGATTLLAPGSNGQVLTLSGGVPTWASAGAATIATNLAGGSLGTIPYQTGPNTTGFLSTGSAGQFLISAGASAPVWTSGSSLSVGSATNLSGGSTGTLTYQSSTGNTAYLSTGSAGQFLISSGASAPVWTNGSSLSVGSATTATTATNIAGGTTGSVPYQTSSGTTTLLAPGTNGYVLTLAAGVPTWAPGSTISLSANNTWTGTQSFIGTTSAIAEKLKNAAELLNVVPSGIPASPTIYAANGAVTYYTGAASNNFTPNFSFSSGTTLDSAMSVGDSLTFVILVKTSSSTSYYSSSLTIDAGGSSVTTVWLNGVPASGSYGSNNVDAYTYTVIKIAAASFNVLAAQSSYS